MVLETPVSNKFWKFTGERKGLIRKYRPNLINAFTLFFLKMITLKSKCWMIVFTMIGLQEIYEREDNVPVGAKYDYG